MSDAPPSTLAPPGVTFGAPLRKDFLMADDWLNLNHGSFGTYPRPIRSTLRHFQDAAEARPDAFIRYDYPAHLNTSRAALATLLHAPLDTLVLVPNATTGVNTVLRNLAYAPGDRILYFASIYGACEKTIQHLAETTPVEGVRIECAYPVADAELVRAFRAAVEGERRRGHRVVLAMFDLVVSMPGVRVPFERLVEACRELGVLSLVDGAHGVGHVELDLTELDPDFLVSNCHKWLFTPRGCAVFYVPLRNQHLIRTTLPTSHGFHPLPKPNQPPIPNPLPPSSPTQSSSPWATNFQFVGTIDSSPYLCIPAALHYRATALGGEAAIRTYCHTLARAGGRAVAAALGTEVLENDQGTLGKCCFSNVRLPLDPEVVRLAAGAGEMVDADADADAAALGAKVLQWMARVMVEEFGTFVALVWFQGAWWARLSAQVYLELADFERAAGILKELCGRVERGEFV